MCPIRNRNPDYIFIRLQQVLGSCFQKFSRLGRNDHVSPFPSDTSAWTATRRYFHATLSRRRAGISTQTSSGDGLVGVLFRRQRSAFPLRYSATPPAARFRLGIGKSKHSCSATGSFTFCRKKKRGICGGNQGKGKTITSKVMGTTSSAMQSEARRGFLLIQLSPFTLYLLRSKRRGFPTSFLQESHRISASMTRLAYRSTTRQWPRTLSSARLIRFTLTR